MTVASSGLPRRRGSRLTLLGYSQLCLWIDPTSGNRPHTDTRRECRQSKSSFLFQKAVWGLRGFAPSPFRLQSAYGVLAAPKQRPSPKQGHFPFARGEGTMVDFLKKITAYLTRTLETDLATTGEFKARVTRR